MKYFLVLFELRSDGRVNFVALNFFGITIVLWLRGIREGNENVKTIDDSKQGSSKLAEFRRNLLIIFCKVEDTGDSETQPAVCSVEAIVDVLEAEGEVSGAPDCENNLFHESEDDKEKVDGISCKRLEAIHAAFEALRRGSWAEVYWFWVLLVLSWSLFALANLGSHGVDVNTSAGVDLGRGWCSIFSTWSNPHSVLEFTFLESSVCFILLPLFLVLLIFSLVTVLLKIRFCLSTSIAWLVLIVRLFEVLISSFWFLVGILRATATATARSDGGDGVGNSTHNRFNWSHGILSKILIIISSRIGDFKWNK